MITWTVPPPRTGTRLNLPNASSVTIALFARVSPALKGSVGSGGTVAPEYAVRPPAAVGLVTVMFKTTSEAPEGISQLPAAMIKYVVPLESGGPLRESRSRQGVVVKYKSPGVSA